MKTKILTFALLLAASMLYAEDVEKMQLVLYYNDAAETQEVIQLDEQPQITFTATDLVVTGHKGGTTYKREIALNSLKRFGYVAAPKIVTSNELVELTDYIATADELRFPTIQRGERVSLYAANGALVMSEVAQGSSLTLSTKSLPQGVYLIDLNSKTAKYIKK